MPSSQHPSWLGRVTRTLRFIVALTLVSSVAYPALSEQSEHLAPARLAPSLSAQQNIPIKVDSAETLYSITDSTLTADGTWQRRVYISVRVNNIESARDYGRISVPYNHYYTDVTLDFANTISADGSISPVAEDALQHRLTGGGQDFYSDSSELVFSLPDITPGSILEFQYTRSSKLLAFEGLYADRTTPYWFQSTVGNDGWRADFVHNYEYRLSAPETQPVFTKTFAGFASKAKRKNKDGVVTQLWRMRNIPAITSEVRMPLTREFIPSLHFSTLNTWDKVDEWAWEKIESKLEATELLDKIIRSLNIPSNASNEDKVRAVYAYLQTNVRYVFAHLGRSGYEPHFPDKVLEASYGDCKDQSVLTVAMLRRLGVNAYPALVETPRAGDADTDTVSLIFDHMIVHIPADQNVSTEWLDSTGDRSLFPGISNYLVDQNALIVDGNGGTLTHISDLGINQASILIDFYTNKDKTTRAEVEFILNGFPEQNIRNWWIHSNDKDNVLNQYLATLFSSYDTYEAKVENHENIWLPTTIKASFTFADSGEEHATYGASITQILRLFTHMNSLPLPDSRKSVFYDKHPFELVMQVHIHGAKNTIPALVRSADEEQNPYFSVSYNSRTQGNDYLLDMHFKRKPLRLTPEEYRQYYTAAEALTNEEIWLVKMLPDTKKSKAEALAKVKQSKGANSAEYYLEEARDFIEQGHFSEALSPAEKAVNMQSTNGEAWYILGMAQGFNSLIDESSRSFAKAEDLGYFPL